MVQSLWRTNGIILVFQDNRPEERLKMAVLDAKLAIKRGRWLEITRILF